MSCLFASLFIVHFRFWIEPSCTLEVGWLVNPYGEGCSICMNGNISLPRFMLLSICQDSMFFHCQLWSHGLWFVAYELCGVIIWWWPVVCLGGCVVMMGFLMSLRIRYKLLRLYAKICIFFVMFSVYSRHCNITCNHVLSMFGHT